MRRRFMYSKNVSNVTVRDEYDYFTVIAGSSDMVLSVTSPWCVVNESYVTIEYSIDGGEWIDMIGEFYIIIPLLSRVRMKCNVTNLTDCEPVFIYSESPFYLGGSIMSLIYGDSAENDVIPEGVYSYGILKTSYDNGFHAVGIENPESFLPATTLAKHCYSNMFSDTFITKAPKLPATMLVESCYYEMFSECENLNHIEMLATDVTAEDCMSGWVRNVATGGTFIKSANVVGLTVGVHGIPEGWTVLENL